MKINFNKSALVFLGERNQFISGIWRCKEGRFPIKYLGLSIQAGKLKKRD